MRFERVQTARLLVRRLLVSDAVALSRYRSLPEIARFQSVFSYAQASELIANMSASDPSVRGQWFQFGIELDGALIGDIGFYNTDEQGRSWIGFTLNPAFWGKGYSAEAVGAVLEFVALPVIWASVDPMNHPSVKLLRRLGFVLVETKPNDLIFRRIAIET